MSSEPADPRTVEQALRKGEVELRKLEAEARTAELSLIVPSLPSEFPRGELDVGQGASPIGSVAAYRSLLAIADDILRELPDAANTVRIADHDVVSRERSVHESVTSVLERLDEELKSARALLHPPKGVLPLGPIAAGITFAGAAGQMIASLMKSNTTVRSQDITMSHIAVGAALAKALLAAGRTVLLDGASSSASSKLMLKARQIEKQRDELAKDLAKYRADQVDEPSAEVAAAAERLASIKAFCNEQAKTKNAEDMAPVFDMVEEAARSASEQRSLLANHAGRVATVTRIVEDVTTALSSLLAVDATGMSAVQVADSYEGNKDAHLLIVEPSYTGAESVYEEKVGKDRGLHMGSAVISYALVDPVGNLVAAGVASSSLSATNNLGSPSIKWGTASAP